MDSASSNLQNGPETLVLLIPLAKVWPHKVPGRWDIAGALLNADARLGETLLKTVPSNKIDLSLAVALQKLGGLFPNLFIVDSPHDHHAPEQSVGLHNNMSK